MENLAEVVPQVVAAAPNNRVVGKIRLQKVFYLLDQLGLGGKLRFSYHNYGPYCENLSTAIDLANHSNQYFEENPQTAKSHGGTYSVFTCNEIPAASAVVGGIDQPRLKQLLKTMTSTTSVVIELAATIHWLKHAEKIDAWEKTLKSRKPTKASAENIRKAQDLLKELDLAA